MKLHIVTLALDAMPWIALQYRAWQRLLALGIDWHWTVVEGVADPVRDTAWCKKIPPRLSQDGTHEFIADIARYHPRVRHLHNPWWPGKTAMMNAALEGISEPCVLLQADSDEIWEPDDIHQLVLTFQRDPSLGRMIFRCLYYVGPDIVTVGEDCYGNNPGEWARAWRYRPGREFVTHEPPVLPFDGAVATRKDTDADNVGFLHFAYATRKQVEFKEQYYGYQDAVKHWERLQANTVWPCRLKDFLPWVDDRARATKMMYI